MSTEITSLPLLVELDPVQVSAIQNGIACPRWVAELLWQRGCKDAASAKEFLNPTIDSMGDPWLYKNMEEAVQTILDFRGSGLELCVFGDYDLDGISGAALVVHALKRAGGWQLSYRLPSRFGHGYGLSTHHVEELHQAGIRGLILVDTGITAHAEIQLAKSLGMKVVVVDHHRPSEAGLPPADAILDVWQEGCTYPNKDLSAVGVASKLITALYERIDLGGSDDFLDLVALGTLSDMMPMVPENRQMLRKALARMHESVFPGIRILCEEAVDQDGFLGSQDILFRIAPMMNAPGRLASPDDALAMLLAENERDARKTIEKLKMANEKRRAIEAEITREALQQASTRVQNNRVLVVDSKGWHLGVLGIVASKLTQAFGRPAAVVSIGDDGVGSASVRGVDGFNWHQALSDARTHFDRWGGHMNAAGFSVKADRMDLVRAQFEESALQQGYEPGVAQPVVECHAEVRLVEMSTDAMNWLRRFEPFGRGNPNPVFVARNVILPSGVREVRGGHLQFEVMQEEGVKFAAIGFGLAAYTSWLREHAKGFDFAFAPTWNSFKGRRVLQLQVRHLFVSG